MKRKKRYLLLELMVLFFVFVQYMVNITVEEKERGQAVFREMGEKEGSENGTGGEEDGEKTEIESEEAVSQNLASQVEYENGVMDEKKSEESDTEKNSTDAVVSGSSIEKDTSEEESHTENEENSGIQKIRVLLKTTESKKNYHDSVKVVPSKDCVLSVIGGSEKKKILKAGKSYTFKENSAWLKKGTVLLTPKKDGKIKISSIRRACGSPSYRGILELTKTEKGIVIVNELPLEEYLYAVVPSEMPVSYGVEALKVQAVCARCYAYSQLASSAMEEFHADVDDSTSYQVYNNVAETEDSRKAVDATRGMVMVTSDGKLITAYYYSTSCGYTANINEAWEKESSTDDEKNSGSNSQENQGQTIGEEENSNETENDYLVGKPQFIKQKEAEKILDLSKEKNFIDFIKKETRQTFDSAFPWYRWTVSISGKSLQSSIEKNWKKRVDANPSMIEIKGNQEKNKASGSKASTKTEEEKTTVSEIWSGGTNLEELGAWKGIEVTSRSTTGMITCIKITYSKASVYVYGEYNIRCLLAPENAKVRRQDGSIVTGLSLLPSSFFYVKEKNGNYVFTGGGYGHGVGMSQNGVKTMAEKGYTWEEILKHYYQGIQIESMEL